MRMTCRGGRQGGLCARVGDKEEGAQQGRHQQGDGGRVGSDVMTVWVGKMSTGEFHQSLISF